MDPKSSNSVSTYFVTQVNCTVPEMNFWHLQILQLQEIRILEFRNPYSPDVTNDVKEIEQFNKT